MAKYFYTDATKAETIKFSDYYSRYTKGSFEDGWFNCSDLEKTFKGFDVNEYYYPEDYSAVELLEVFIYREIIRFTDPQFDEPTKTVSYYESKDKRDKQVRTTSKVGKYIRKVAPYFNDKQVESLVNEILEAHKVPTYTHHVARTPKEFQEVYTMRPESGANLDNYKCINASCMRDKFGGRQHPCSIYGSGDFELHYLLNEQGRIAARSILCLVDNAYAPVYVSNRMAGKELERLMKETYEDAVDAEDAGRPWDGAKLLKIKCDDGWLAPYIDVQQAIEEHDDYFVISYTTDDYNFCSTGGYANRNCKCASCGDRVSYYDIVEHDGEEYCCGCVRFCDYSEETTTEECVEVWTGRYCRETWKLSIAEEHAVYDEATDKWYKKEYNEERTKAKTGSEIVLGSVVRIVANSNHSRNHVGDIGVASDSGWGDDGFDVVIPGRDLQNSNGCYTRLRDMVLYKFEVGDKVRIGQNASSYHCFSAGTIGEIVQETNISYLIKVGEAHQFVPKDQVEVVLTVVTE